MGGQEQEHPRTSKERLLTQEEPSHAAGIADAVVIKDEGLYFLCKADGSVPHGRGHGLGLYFHDCRYLCAYELRIAGQPLESLAANDGDGFRAIFQLTNPNIEPVGKGISRQRIGFRLRRLIDGKHGEMQEELTVENFDTQPHAFSLSIALDADFQDVFAIRGLTDLRPGQLSGPRWEKDELVFSQEGGDGRRRRLGVRFSEPPEKREGGKFSWELELEPHERKELLLSFSVAECETKDPWPVSRQAVTLSEAEAEFARSLDEWMEGFARVRSTSLWLERAVDRGLQDLRTLRMAELFEWVGEDERASELKRDAEALKRRFNEDFWIAEKGMYAMALERGGKAVDAAASNPGQALWTGIVSEDRVEAVVRRLMEDDLYSGWGIRTLGSREKAYNPVGYHLGTVWPHDNANIADGFRKHGFHEEACLIFFSLVEASTYFPNSRLPEAFAGFPRAEYGIPVHYPVACHPQAWAAGAIPFLLQSLLGFEVEGLAKRLCIRPKLPSFVDRLEFRRLRVADATVDLVFERQPGGEMRVEVENQEGELEIRVG